MFVGYFFPGERDRGAMVAADLSSLGGWLEGMDLYGGVFNGNRFFDDNNDDLNVNLRLRKSFSERPFAIGVSLQTGKQVMPPDAASSARATVYGVDAQWVLGRLGIRAEYVRGDTPSTLLGLEPDFAPGYEPGAKTSGADAFFDYRLTMKDEAYWRWDWLKDDPVTRADVRAFNAGYLRRLGKNSHIGFDYQWKNGVTYNDDKVNTRFAIRWSLVY
jgi:phosphate-selective porin